MDEAALFPRIRGAEGRLSGDGKALLVEALTDSGDVVRFSVDLGEVQHLVSYLLVWTARLAAEHTPASGIGEAARVFSHPIPVTAVSMGTGDGGEGLLGISVGPAELLFSIPMAALGSIGKTLLTASVQPHEIASA
jgi:hypothetical protein